MEILRKVSQWVLAIAIAAPVVAHAAENDALRGKRSALTSIGAVQDIDARPDEDDPRGGGGFDAEGYFQNIVITRVSACVSNVLKEFVSWTREQSLNVSKTSQTEVSVLAFAQLTSPPGILELDYRFRKDTKRSRATLFFFSLDGSKHEPEALIELLKQYKVAALQDGIRIAVACK